MGTQFSPPYDNLSVKFLEDIVLLPVELPKYFSHDNCKLIEELFKRYMDDCFLPCHSTLDLNVLKNVLNTNLQGPANNPANSKNILFLVSTCYPNFDIPNIIKSKTEAKSKWINQRKFWRNTNSFVIKTTI